MRSPRLALPHGALPSPRTSRALFVFLAAVALAATLLVAVPPMPPVTGASGTPSDSRSIADYGNLPISFEANVGQVPNRFDFLARGQGYGMAINATGATLALGAKDVVRLGVVGADRSAQPRALESLPGVVNYFMGDDPAKWHSDVATYARVAYSDVLPGIGLTYYGTNGGTLEYDFVVAPGADPNDIRVAFAGADDLALKNGGLVITTATGEITQDAPVLYQEIGGRRVPVDGRFSLVGHEIGFEVGTYDDRYALVIDPVLSYSTYLGGTGTDIVQAVAVDASGAAYVSGYTTSTDFPLVGAFQTSFSGVFDAFVSKLDPSGSALVYSTYLGGSGIDNTNGIAVDGSGSAYVAGATLSSDFPVTPGVFQTLHAGSDDTFVTKLTPTGVLDFSTYLGGSASDPGHGIAVDGSGSAYLTGYTNSADFPTTPGAFQTVLAGAPDAFVTKLNPTGSALVYSTFVGGSAVDAANGGIAIDGTGAAHIAGTTSSVNFPTTAGAFQTVNAGVGDVFVTKLNSTGSALVYSTFVGGSGSEGAYEVAVEGAGSAYVAGYTGSSNFPTVSPFQPSNGGGTDAFVSKFDPAGSVLASTYLGGSGDEVGYGIALDGSGAPHVTGYTTSSDFPTASPLQASNAGGYDAFVAKFDGAISALGYSTYLGGTGDDLLIGIAVDGSGAAYATGYTTSSDFPLESPFQVARNGSVDAIVAKVSLDPVLTPRATLTVTRTGSGVGIVSSSPTGINCGYDCTQPYLLDTTVTLTAEPSSFVSWSGCDEVVSGECTVEMSADRTVTATFSAEHARNLRFTRFGHGKHRFVVEGLLDAPGFPACAALQAVSLERKSNGSWSEVTAGETDEARRFRLTGPDRPGRYRVLAVESAASATDTCLTTQGTKRHRH